MHVLCASNTSEIPARTLYIWGKGTHSSDTKVLTPPPCLPLTNVKKAKIYYVDIKGLLNKNLAFFETLWQDIHFDNIHIYKDNLQVSFGPLRRRLYFKYAKFILTSLLLDSLHLNTSIQERRVVVDIIVAWCRHSLNITQFFHAQDWFASLGSGECTRAVCLGRL